MMPSSTASVTPPCHPDTARRIDTGETVQLIVRIGRNALVKTPEAMLWIADNKVAASLAELAARLAPPVLQ